MPKFAPYYGPNAAGIVQHAAPQPAPGGAATLKKKDKMQAAPVQEKPMPGSESVRERRDKQISELVFFS